MLGARAARRYDCRRGGWKTNKAKRYIEARRLVFTAYVESDVPECMLAALFVTTYLMLALGLLVARHWHKACALSCKLYDRAQGWRFACLHCKQSDNLGVNKKAT